ncbi:MAG: hypothetical protein QOD09_1235 [Bradyrhizobium sp.]|jgi:hypothetical protein|nr:hypothetical protein [Bradyrhizobium sp.]
MTIPTKPFLAIHVAWHPAFGEGEKIARTLFEHYRRNLYQNVAGGTGIPVMYRSTPPAGSVVPIDIDLESAETAAVILLVDENWANSAEWLAWGKKVSDEADRMGLRAFVFPVAVDQTGIERGVVPEQAVRWDQWGAESDAVKLRRMLTALSYEFCRMLRQYLERLQQPSVSDDDLESYLRRVQVFVSHSKHDEHGVKIAQKIRGFVQDRGYDAFFDVFDIPIGQRFDRVLLLKVKKSAVVAIHTDSYSSREWCRKEMIQAKKHDVPVVVADCIDEIDERGFPYMANVPIVRMDPVKIDRIEVVVGRLIDEVLKDFLWRCRVKVFETAAGTNVAFVPRPPELIVLTALKEKTPARDVLVYPDPPIGAEELELFSVAAPGVRLLSATEFIAGAAT